MLAHGAHMPAADNPALHEHGEVFRRFKSSTEDHQGQVPDRNHCCVCKHMQKNLQVSKCTQQVPYWRQ